MAKYELFIEITDKRRGWTVGTERFLPRAYTITVRKYARFTDDDGARLDEPRELTAAEVVAAQQSPGLTGKWNVGLLDWLELHVETTEQQQPCCVTLHAPRGIGTPEQRAPLAGIVTEASARLASRKGGYFDLPGPIEYEDAKWELGRARGRKRARRKITDERLETVARLAREHPRTPTAAVQHHFRISRGYARRLIKLAEAGGYNDVIGKGAPDG